MTVSRTNFPWDLFRLPPSLHVPNSDLTKKPAITTGRNSGIGFQISLKLARRGATVHLASRTASRADIAVS